MCLYFTLPSLIKEGLGVVIFLINQPPRPLGTPPPKGGEGFRSEVNFSIIYALMYI
jgi:hypothetical protein